MYWLPSSLSSSSSSSFYISSHKYQMKTFISKINRNWRFFLRFKKKGFCSFIDDLLEAISLINIIYVCGIFFLQKMEYDTRIPLNIYMLHIIPHVEQKSYIKKILYLLIKFEWPLKSFLLSFRIGYNNLENVKISLLNYSWVLFLLFMTVFLVGKTFYLSEKFWVYVLTELTRIRKFNDLLNTHWFIAFTSQKYIFEINRSRFNCKIYFANV